MVRLGRQWGESLVRLENCEATLERCHERLNGISNGIGDVGEK